MIETPRLLLVPFELGHAAALERGRSELAAVLGVDIPDGWPQFPEAYTTKGFWRPKGADKGDPDSMVWGTYLFLYRDRSALVGSGGFKGRPAAGGVEIGYEIAPAFQGRGFATEASQGMIDLAFAHPGVEFVVAHTLTERNASTSVLVKAGMALVGTVDDPEDGPIWRWRLDRK